MQAYLYAAPQFWNHINISSYAARIFLVAILCTDVSALGKAAEECIGQGGRSEQLASSISRVEPWYCRNGPGCSDPVDLLDSANCFIAEKRDLCSCVSFQGPLELIPKTALA